MALIRPGPMEMAPDYISRKHGQTAIEYMHPDMEPILRETYGVALYQEQVIRIANVLAGFSMAEGDGFAGGWTVSFGARGRCGSRRAGSRAPGPRTSTRRAARRR